MSVEFYWNLKLSYRILENFTVQKSLLFSSEYETSTKSLQNIDCAMSCYEDETQNISKINKNLYKFNEFVYESVHSILSSWCAAVLNFNFVAFETFNQNSLEQNNTISSRVSFDYLARRLEWSVEQCRFFRFLWTKLFQNPNIFHENGEEKSTHNRFFGYFISYESSIALIPPINRVILVLLFMTYIQLLFAFLSFFVFPLTLEQKADIVMLKKSSRDSRLVDLSFQNWFCDGLFQFDEWDSSPVYIYDSTPTVRINRWEKFFQRIPNSHPQDKKSVFPIRLLSLLLNQTWIGWKMSWNL